MSSRQSFIERPSLGRQVCAEANLAQIYGALGSSKFTVESSSLPSHMVLSASVTNVLKVDIDTSWPVLSFSEEEAALERWTNMEKMLRAEEDAAEADRQANAAAATEAAEALVRAEEERARAEAEEAAARAAAETRRRAVDEAAREAAAVEEEAGVLIEARARAFEAEKELKASSKASSERLAAIAQVVAVTGMVAATAATEGGAGSGGAATAGALLDQHGGDVTAAVRAFFAAEEEAVALSQARALADLPSPRNAQEIEEAEASARAVATAGRPSSASSSPSSSYPLGMVAAVDRIGANEEAVRLSTQQIRLEEMRVEDAALADRLLHLGTAAGSTGDEISDAQRLDSGGSGRHRFNSSPAVLSADPFGAPTERLPEDSLGQSSAAAVVNPFSASNPFVDANPFPPPPRQPPQPVMTTSDNSPCDNSAVSGWGLDGAALLRSSLSPPPPPPEYPHAPPPPQYSPSSSSSSSSSSPSSTTAQAAARNTGSSPSPPLTAAQEIPPMAYDAALGQPSAYSQQPPNNSGGRGSAHNGASGSADGSNEDKVQQLVSLTRKSEDECLRMLASESFDLDRACNAYFSGAY